MAAMRSWRSASTVSRCLIEHGYPARLVVPGLYGYVSATKWVVEMELTRFDRAEAYWTRQGWAPRAPIKTESRIDVPKDGQRVPIGPVVFGGVAWAQNRGVRAVEVLIDDGGWQPAQQGASYSNGTWRLWSFPWQAKSPGKHTITVRATDNTGAVQTADRVGSVPRRRHRLAHGGLHRGGAVKHYFDESFRQLNTGNHEADQHGDRTNDGPGRRVAHRATAKHSEPGAPRSDPNSATINPNASVATKVLLIWGGYAAGAGRRALSVTIARYG